MHSANADVVVIGAGSAGHALARALRRRDPLCTITLIAAHSAAVYPKNALATALAAGRDPLRLVQATAEMVAAREDLHLIEQSPVQFIDLAQRAVEMVHGSIPFERVVLAVGEEVGMPDALRGNPAVCPINRLADYSRLRPRMAGARRVLILGAGIRACEFANELALSGRQAIVLDPARHPLGERLPALAARRLRADLERAGVQFRLGERLLSVDPIAANRYRAYTSCNDRIEVDAVISLIEPRPRVVLARAAGLSAGRLGIDVDGRLGAGVAGVFAIGACARLPSAIAHAGIEAQAQALAETLCGRSTQPESRPEAIRLNTPDAEFVLFEPPPIAGEWQERATPGGVGSAFIDRNGRLRGFALAGSAVDRRKAWLARLAR
ncbi:MAG: FAD-dependent oxidoreductase [Rhodocyclaceae bacterium]|nr:FAD-dependent oxidoreductase [Rhodocyclaceae bacterium]